MCLYNVQGIVLALVIIVMIIVNQCSDKELCLRFNKDICINYIEPVEYAQLTFLMRPVVHRGYDKAVQKMSVLQHDYG